jgi:hypothetical protein
MMKIPFAKLFQTVQMKTINANAEDRVFYGEIPNGCTGFLSILASNDFEGILWSWYIDGECIEENIQRPLGNLIQPTVFKPPYVVNKYIEVRAKNTLQLPAALEAYCDGIYCNVSVPIEVKPVIPPAPTVVLQEIREELKSDNPVGEVTDELIDVTDAVKDVYDEAQHGLQWTVCDLINRGPNNVYVVVNQWKQPVAPLLPGESQNIDLGKRGSIKRIYLKCDAGETAQVRLHALK